MDKGKNPGMDSEDIVGTDELAAFRHDPRGFSGCKLAVAV